MLNRLARDSGASVSVEFAICVPVLLALFLGAYVASDLVACNRRVGVATRTLTDLVSRNMSPSAIAASPSTASATPYLTGSAITLFPYSPANATEQIALLRVCDATSAYVVWTQAQTQTASGTATAATPTLTAGSLSASSVITLPTSMISSAMVPASPDGSDVCKNYAASTASKTQVGTAGSFLFVGAISYSYLPPINYLVYSALNIGDTFYMSPRLY